MPYLEETFLQEILDEANRGKEAVVPAHPNGALEPLCAVYPVDALPALRAFFDGGGRSVKAALERIPIRTIPAPAQIVTNVNTPEQWEAVR